MDHQRPALDNSPITGPAPSFPPTPSVSVPLAGKKARASRYIFYGHCGAAIGQVAVGVANHQRLA